MITGILVVAINLRPALASVGPLIGEIRADTGLPNAALGLLTTLPLIAFGCISTLTPLVTRRLGMGGALVISLALLSAGAALRAAPSVALLFLGTTVLGVGIALGNVLLPALVKRDFAHHSGFMTSLYASTMGLGATIAAGSSVPLGSVLGWRNALGIWTVPAVIALIVWLPQLSRTNIPPFRQPGSTSRRSLAGSKRAWQIALFMGLQSLTFYVILAWLPDILQSRGVDAAEAGFMLALSQATGIVGSAAVPLWAGRVADQRPIAVFLGALEAITFGGLILDDSGSSIAIWVSILGFVLGGTFGLSLLLLVLRAHDTETATALSGMAQSVGYLIAAAGPAAFGILYDVTGTWMIPLLFLVAILGGKVVAGTGAGRPGYLESSRLPQE